MVNRPGGNWRVNWSWRQGSVTGNQGNSHGHGPPGGQDAGYGKNWYNHGMTKYKWHNGHVTIPKSWETNPLVTVLLWKIAKDYPLTLQCFRVVTCDARLITPGFPESPAGIIGYTHQMGHQNEGRTNQKMRSNPSKQENIWREDQPKWDIYINTAGLKVRMRFWKARERSILGKKHSKTASF